MKRRAAVTAADRPRRARRVQVAPVQPAPPAKVIEPVLRQLGAPAGRRAICMWPPNALSPNSRAHWSKVHRAKAAYRLDCFILAKEAKLRAPKEGPIHVRLDMFPLPVRNANQIGDDDNVESRFKAGRDGIAQALGVDDARFCIEKHLHRDQQLGCVVVTIIEGSNDG